VQDQTYRNIEIIVVDGMSEDDTAKLVGEAMRRDNRIRIVPNPDRITPRAMNVGLENSRGEWLVRIDAHATVPTDYVERAVAHLRTGEWSGVGGRKDGMGITSAGRAIAAAMASPFGVGGSTYHHGTEVREVEHVPFGAYPVNLARSIGGWDERLRVNQDFEFDWRIRRTGRPLLFDPRLRIDWICRQSVRDLLRQYVRYGRGKVRVAAMHPKSVSLRHLVPPLMFLWIVAATLVAPFRPLLAALAVAPYVLFVAVGVIATAPRVPKGDRRHLWLIFPAMHLGWGYGFCRGALDILLGRR